MSDDSLPCPECQSPYGYQSGQLWICPECAHEWIPENGGGEEPPKFLDSNGVQLMDGDSVSVIRDLKAGKETIKSGTKVRKIKLLDDPVNDHDISCKIDGFGQVYLKCSVVKKIK